MKDGRELDARIPLLCRLGLHKYPKNHIVELYGAVFHGGWCPRCEDVIYGRFIMNAWGNEINHGHAIELSGSNPKLVEAIESGKYVWAHMPEGAVKDKP